MKFLVEFGLICVAVFGSSVFSAIVPAVVVIGKDQAEVPSHPIQSTGIDAATILNQGPEPDKKDVLPPGSSVDSAPKARRSADSNRHLDELNEDDVRRVARSPQRGGYPNYGGYQGAPGGPGGYGGSGSGSSSYSSAESGSGGYGGPGGAGSGSSSYSSASSGSGSGGYGRK